VRITVVATGFDPERVVRPSTRVRMATPREEVKPGSGPGEPEGPASPPAPNGAPHTRRQTRSPAADAAETAESPDDLDIPSFLRRN
jgi:hypothetical protein